MSSEQGSDLAAPGVHRRPIGETSTRGWWTSERGSASPVELVILLPVLFAVMLQFTPTHASWINLVEVWFSIVERQAIRRGVFKSVKDLNTKIRTFVDGWNDRSHPFVWTKTAEEILNKANRPTTPNPRH